jgi:hypothetical protein
MTRYLASLLFVFLLAAPAFAAGSDAGICPRPVDKSHASTCSESHSRTLLPKIKLATVPARRMSHAAAVSPGIRPPAGANRKTEPKALKADSEAAC